jgi:hypothetical protein
VRANGDDDRWGSDFFDLWAFVSLLLIGCSRKENDGAHEPGVGGQQQSRHRSYPRPQTPLMVRNFMHTNILNGKKHGILLKRSLYSSKVLLSTARSILQTRYFSPAVFPLYPDPALAHLHLARCSGQSPGWHQSSPRSLQHLYYLSHGLLRSELSRQIRARTCRRRSWPVGDTVLLG